jgi:hypothetical protein
VVRFRCHPLELALWEISDEIDFKRMRDRELCFLLEIRAASDGINRNRIALEEGRGEERLLEFCTNATRCVLCSESKEFFTTNREFTTGGSIR